MHAKRVVSGDIVSNSGADFSTAKGQISQITFPSPLKG